MTKNKNENVLKIYERSKERTRRIATREGEKLKLHEVVYRTFDRWASRNDEITTKKVRLLADNSSIKEEVARATRKFQEKTHEQINAASQLRFFANIILGKQVSSTGRVFERNAKLKNSDERVFATYIAQFQRIPTSEFMTRPEKAKDIENTSKRLTRNDSECYVLTGHTGAVGCNKKGIKYTSKHQVVSKLGASTGERSVHTAQLKAQRDSSSFITLSRRLSEIMDNFQENGIGILKAFDDKNGDGFFVHSNWKGFYIKNAEDALIVAIKAKHFYKKRQTKEKKLRETLEEPESASADYSEIRTESETNSENFDSFVLKVTDRDQGYEAFLEFAEEHKINLKSKVFKQKLTALDDTLSNICRY